MSLIIEGCDLTGKTTLAKSLHWPIVTKKNDARGKKCLESCMNLTDGYTIWDRWWITEYIYDKLFRNQNICSKFDMWKFKLLADVKGAVIIYLDVPDYILRRRYNEKKEEVDFNSIINLKITYSNFFARLSKFLPPIFKKHQLNEALIMHSKLQKRAIEYKSFSVDGWGTLDENQILICGEKYGPDSKSRYPFEFHTEHGCGKYFIVSLNLVNIDPNQIHIMNLYRLDGQGDWRGVINLLKPRKIIALGKKVNKELKEFSPIYVPHPAYWKRFNYNLIQEYSEILRKSML